MVPETFWNLLALRTPQSLLIFAHFGALVSHQATGPWWIEGFGRDIVLAIYGILRVELEDQAANFRGGLAGGVGGEGAARSLPQQQPQQQMGMEMDPTQAPRLNLTTPSEAMDPTFQPQPYTLNPHAAQPLDTQMTMDTLGLDLGAGPGATPSAANPLPAGTGFSDLGKRPVPDAANAEAGSDMWMQLDRWQETERRKQFWVRAMEWPLRRAELIK